MRNVLLTRWKLIGVTVALAGVAACLPPASGFPGQDPPSAGPTERHPAELAVTLEQQTIVPGQPVIVSVRVTNRSKTTLAGLEFRHTFTGGWLRFEVRDAEGKVIRQDPRPTTWHGVEPNPPRPDGLTIYTPEDGEDTIPGDLLPGKSQQWRFVLPPKMIPSEPGRYTLVARATLTTGGRTAPREALPKLPVPLTVGAYDRERLRQLAEGYRRVVTNPEDGNAILAFDALMAIPPSAARSVWRALALDTRLPSYQRLSVAARLYKQGSSDAQNILRAMRDREPEGSPFRKELEGFLRLSRS